MTVVVMRREPNRGKHLVGTELRPEEALREQVDTFVAEHYGRVVSSVALATGDRIAAEDGVQAALVKVLSGRHRPDSMRAWVTVVAINEVRQAQRRRRTEQLAVSKLTPQAGGEPEDLVVRPDVREAVEELPDRQRDIVLLFYYLDQPVAQIARAMGISEGTVKTQLHRARQRLVERFDIQEGEL